MVNRLKEAYNSRGGGIAALVIVGIVVVVVVISIILAFADPKDPETAPENPTVPPTSSSPAPSNPEKGGVCNVPAGNMSLRPESPSDLRWEVKNGWTWPVSDSLGPTKETEGHPTCFARSPLGAGLFLTSVMNESWTDEKSVNSVLAFYMADQEGKNFIQKQESQSSDVKQMKASGWSNAGFRVEYFTENEATISMVLSAPNTETGYAGIQMDLVWVNDDWRLDSKQFMTPAGASPEIEPGSFTEWAE